ncbi:hypothetical protein I4U23_005289 [Adineta vaga]|nr:hypothetical protein I4U23_005289 [Adineta vaga]
MVMSFPKVFHDTKNLPRNILTLVDDDFYRFVEQRLGVYQALLLKIQQINSVPCFLLSGDPCEVLNLNIDDDDVNDLKRKMCFILSDSSCFIKPGVRTGFKCLNELLSKETDHKLKQSRNIRTELPTFSSVNILISPSSILTSSITTTISTQQPTMPQGLEQTLITSASQQPTAASASQQSATTPIPQETTSTPSSYVPSSISISEHRKYLLNLLKHWCSNHKNEFNLETFDLKDGKDFMLYVKRGANDVIEASIKCNCGRLIILTKKDENFQSPSAKIKLKNKTIRCIRFKCIYFELLS